MKLQFGCKFTCKLKQELLETDLFIYDFDERCALGNHSLKIKDVPSDLHDKIVHMMFLELSSFPCESSIEYSEMKHYSDIPERYERQDFSDMSFLDFKKYIANLIFDKESTVGKPSAIL